MASHSSFISTNEFRTVAISTAKAKKENIKKKLEIKYIMYTYGVFKRRNSSTSRDKQTFCVSKSCSPMKIA